jgi:hypothetical protein
MFGLLVLSTLNHQSSIALPAKEDQPLNPQLASTAYHSLQTPGATGDHSLPNGPAEQKLAVAVSSLQSSVEPKIDVSITTWFLPKQLA